MRALQWHPQNKHTDYGRTQLVCTSVPCYGIRTVSQGNVAKSHLIEPLQKDKNGEHDCVMLSWQRLGLQKQGNQSDLQSTIRSRTLPKLVLSRRQSNLPCHPSGGCSTIKSACIHHSLPADIETCLCCMFTLWACRVARH